MHRIDPGIIAAALLPLAGIWPSFGRGVIDSADGPLHVQRIFAFATMLAEGNLWPRWIPWFHLGFGYPIFNFYPPGVFALGGVLTRLGLEATTAFNLVAALAWILGSIGTYRLAKRCALPATGALLAAAVWSYAPSRLFEVWDQGSLPQMMAAALVPWLLAGLVDAAFRPGRRSAVAVALPLVGIILSHQPITFITALYTAPVSLLLPLWAARRSSSDARLRARLVCVFGGLTLGVGLAAIFLLPLAAELRFVQAARGAEDNVDYLISNFLRPHELFILPQPANLTDLRFELPTTLGLAGALLAAAGLVALIRRRRMLALVLAVGLASTLFMLLEPSLPVWLTIPFFRQLRFPERFLRIGALLIALLAAGSLLLLPRRFQAAGMVAGMVIVLVAALPLVYPNQEFVSWDGLSARDEIEFEERTYTWGTTSYDEFDPQWGQDIPLPVGRVPEPEAYETDPTRIVVYRVDMARYGDIMQVEQLDTARMRVRLSQPHRVRLHQYYFPGWQGWVDGQPAAPQPDEQFGLMAFDLPAGDHTIEVRYVGTSVQHLGAALTVICLAVTAVLWRTGRRAEQARPESDSLGARTALAVGAAAVLFAAVNTVIISPNTLLFRHRSPADAPVAMQTPVQADFGGVFELLGYTLDQREVTPGDLLSVTLYWRALRTPGAEYRPVVQLVNLPVTAAWGASEPFFPGGGHTAAYPTDRFASDVHDIRVFATAPPYVGRLMVQMLDAETGAPLRLPDGSDRLLLDPLIRLRGETSRVQTAAFAGTRIGTVEVDCAAARRADERIEVDLHWHVLQPPGQDVTTFVHGLDADGTLVEQADGPPLAGQYPASLWLPQQTLRDVYTLPDNPAITQVAFGLYTDTGRLEALRGGQPMPDNRIVIPIEDHRCTS